MSFTQQVAFARGRKTITDLTNAAQEVVANANELQITGVTISGGAAAEVVVFRSQDGNTTYFKVPVGIAGHTTIPFTWLADEGLEVLTESAAGDVGVTIFYVKP